MSTDEKILFELKKLAKMFQMVYSSQLNQQLNGLATTNERKMIWALIDGQNTSKNIADTINVTKRSVDRFLKLAEDLGYVLNPWGKPAIRFIDYVPLEWISLLSDIENW